MKSSFLALITIVYCISCVPHEEIVPEPYFNKPSKGAYVKLLNETERVLGLSKPEDSTYEFVGEFVDIENGRTVTEFIILAQYQDNNIIDRDLLTGFTSFRNITDFELLQNKSIGVKVEISLKELKENFQIDSEDLKVNDQFIFKTIIKTNDGASYGSENSSPTINGPHFNTHFDFTLVIE